MFALGGELDEGQVVVEASVEVVDVGVLVGRDDASRVVRGVVDEVGVACPLAA